VNDNAMQLAFAGSPEFAAVILESLADNPGMRIRQVYTQPDRAAGRGRKTARNPVALLADKRGIPVLQPERPADIDPEDRLSGIDALIVAAYGMLLPAEILNKPKWGCINVHTSLLPRWRGAAPIQRALEAGDRETGITIMRMDAGLDTGPILMQEACPILPTDTAGILHDRLAQLGAGCLMRCLDRLADGSVSLRIQDDRIATYARKISKEEARIVWSRPAVEIERQVRSFNPQPVAFTEVNGMQVRIWEVELLEQDLPGAMPGRFFRSASDLIVQTGRGSLRIVRLQAPGKRPVAARDFLNGHPELAHATAKSPVH
jgi:methionyl-tRNA formyltransferase